jgi:hypothetical protein
MFVVKSGLAILSLVMNLRLSQKKGFGWLTERLRPPLLSSDQSSWLQIRRSWFYSRRYQIFWEAVSLKLGPLSLVSKIEELLGRNSSGSSLESLEYGHRDPLRWQSDTLYPQKLALTSPTSGDSSVGVVLSRTQATVFLFLTERLLASQEGLWPMGLNEWLCWAPSWKFLGV